MPAVAKRCGSTPCTLTNSLVVQSDEVRPEPAIREHRLKGMLRHPI
jgi:hypothetical protein